ncbi:hypothetical protein AB4Y38_12425 [Paraburkholderia sp. EG285A]|uniref:hypothetical protein n=1 Tax=Paraburkholderia sp. EG285A TaxID=3237009 RepID=UPI0034D3735C
MDAEVYERYIVCEDLAQQLVTYTARKMAENAWSLQTILPKVKAGFLKKTRSGIWEFSDAEVTWTIGRTREILSDPASGRTSPDSNIQNQAGEEKRDE